MANIQSEIILLHASQYNVVDEQTGERSSGTSISYYFNTGLDPVNNTDGSKGLRPAKCASDFGLMTKVLAAPALYLASFEMSIGSNMKPVLKICDLEYIDDVKVVAAGH